MEGSSMKKVLLLMATALLFALVWASAAAADTYTPIQISSASINAQQQLTVTWVTPTQGLSLVIVTWDLWNPTTKTWGDWADVADGSTAAGYSTVTLLQPEDPPADASSTVNLAVRISAWDTACTWDNNGQTWSGCDNYSPWTYANLKASCTQNVITAGYYNTVTVTAGHYVTKLVTPRHYVMRNGKRVLVKAKYREVWVPPVTNQVWVAPVYGADTCVWVNS